MACATSLLEDEEHLIPFEKLPVECPTISVRKVVKMDNIVKFQDGGEYIMNTATKKKLRFIENNGVYFIKIGMTPPTDIDENHGSGFSQPR